MNSVHEETHVSNRHMKWWQNAWWVRVDNGPHLRTSRDRRKVWRAAARSAQEVRETGKVAGREREEWEQGKTERKESNTLHVVFHFPTANATTQQPHQQQQQQQPQSPAFRCTMSAPLQLLRSPLVFPRGLREECAQRFPSA